MKLFLPRFISVCCFIIYGVGAFSQNSIIDSLKLQLSKTNDTNKVKVLNDLTWEFYIGGWYNEAKQYANQAISECSALPASRSKNYFLAHAYNNLGNVYGDQSEYNSALEYYNLSLALRKKINDKKGMAGCYNNIGGIYRYLGELDTALACHFNSLKLKDEIGDKKGVASSYHNIGNIYSDKHLSDKALEYYGKSLKIKEELGNKLGIADSYISIGIIFRQKKELQKCLDFYSKGSKIYEELGARQRLANCYNNMGNLFEDLKDYNKALNYHHKSITLREEMKDKMGMASSYSNMGNIYTTQKKYVQAKEVLQKGLQLAKEINALPDMMGANSALAVCEARLGNFEKAYYYQREYSAIRDTIFSMQSAAKSAEIEEKYNSEKKDKEIIKKNSEIKLRDAALKLRDADSKKKSLQRNFLLGGLLLVLVLLLVIYFSFRQKQKANIALETKNEAIQLQKELIEEQHWQLSEKNKEITQSIQYSKRIQQAILPPSQFISKLLPNQFVLFKPKDIVSGDFYWIEKFGNQVIVAAVDCTGHGVPGAFMTFVAHSLLNEAVNEHGITKPAVILSEMRKGLFKLLHVGTETDYIKDGMDIAVCAIDFTAMKMEYAGAYNPAWIIRRNECIELEADKTPIGAFINDDHLKPFTNHELDLQSGDCIYLFSDGYADQFGNPVMHENGSAKIKAVTGKKLKRKRFKELLLSVSHLSCEEQKSRLDSFFMEWKNNLEQVDDVLVVGVKI